MKWKDLSLKERKQIYDSVRVNNPDATYFDIKEQFDSIPTYEDGKGKTINKADLPPEYRTGTPEYFERQRKISGAINTVQPEAYGTNYKKAASAIAFQDVANRGKYVKHQQMYDSAGNPITQDKIEEYLSYRSKYANRVNPVLRTLYDIRPDKQGFINRMNNLTPIEWAVPLGLPMFFGEEQENK